MNIDFVQAFLQAKLDVPNYKDLPLGFNIDSRWGKQLLKFDSILYELKQGR